MNFLEVSMKIDFTIRTIKINEQKEFEINHFKWLERIKFEIF